MRPTLGPQVEPRTSAQRDAFLVRLDDATRPLVDPHAITQAAARLLGEHLAVNRCAYADVEADEDAFNLTGDYHRDVPSIVGRYRFAQFGAECLRLMRAGLPYRVEDAEADPRIAEVREAYRATLIRSVICVPLRKGERFVAAMAVHQASPRAWRDDEVELVAMVASRCWESIERSRIERELRASEERLRAALEATRLVAWDYDILSDRVRHSQTAAEVLGILPGHPLVSAADWHARIHPADRGEHQAVLAAAIRDGASYHSEFRWTRPDDGAVVWIEASGRVRLDARGTATVIAGMLGDISQRKHAEIERERFFGIGLELMVIAGFDGRFQRVSPNWEQVLGWTAEELTSRPWLDFIHPDDHAASIAEAARLFAGEGTASFENRYRTRTGEWRWLHWKLKPYPEERLLYGAATDITTRKRAEQRDAFFVRLDDALRPLGEPKEISQVAARLLGEQLQADRCVYCVFEPDEDHFETLSYSMRPEIPSAAGHYRLDSFGEEAARRFRANLPSVVHDTERDAAVADSAAAYLGMRILAHASVPLHKAGRLVGAMGVHQATPRRWRDDEVDLVRLVASRCWESIERARAVDELRRQWHTFDVALSHTPDFTYVFDLQGRFTYVNRSLLDLWGKPLDEAVGKDFLELEYPPGLAARLQRQIREVIDTGRPVRDETPFTGVDGVTRHYEYIFVPVSTREGRIRNVAGSMRDVTERMRTEEHLRLANDKLTRINRELEQYTYVVSHDLQEPLRMVTGFVTLLDRRVREQLDDAARGYIARAVDGVQRMQLLIRDLLVYAKLDRMSPLTVVDLGKAFAMAVEHLRLRAEEAQAVITADPLPQVTGNDLQLVQLFQNLIGNAIKFRRPGQPPRIHVAAAPGEPGGWTIAVRDNGIGIPVDHRQRIFDVFQRLHGGAAYEGTGIGLAICKKIVENHGGAIAVESRDGEGTTFVVTLPGTPAGGPPR